MMMVVNERSDVDIIQFVSTDHDLAILQADFKLMSDIDKRAKMNTDIENPLNIEYI